MSAQTINAFIMNAFKTTLGLCIFFASVYTQFHQNSYTIDHDRVDNIKCNKSVLRRPDFKVLQYNDSLTTKVLNGSGHLVITLTEMKINAIVYRYVRNAYRIFPINVTLDGCRPNKKNVLGLQSIFNHTNFNRCPVAAGYYYLKYYLLEEEKFPPHIPLGQYKLTINAYTTDNAFVCSGDWYGAVVRRTD